MPMSGRTQPLGWTDKEVKMRGNIAMSIVSRIVRENYPAAVITLLGEGFRFSNSNGQNFTGKVLVTAYQMNPIIYKVKCVKNNITLTAVR